MKLNQFIALLKGSRGTSESALTKAYHMVSQSPRLVGILKTYKPRDEEGETLPSEGSLLQLRVPEIMDGVVDPLIRLLDLTATVDVGNTIAKQDVIVDGVTILEAVPVTTLLYLEKKLVDFATVVSKLPVLDPSEEWEPGDDGISWKTKPSTRVRTKKVPFVLEKSPATDKHQAQTEVLHEDKVVGDWTTIQYSGAISAKKQRELLTKVAKLRDAVKIAREAANNTEVTDFKIGAQIFDFLGWSGIVAE